MSRAETKLLVATSVITWVVSNRAIPALLEKPYGLSEYVTAAFVKGGDNSRYSFFTGILPAFMLCSLGEVIPLAAPRDSRAIANLLLKVARSRQIKLSNLKLQKLLFLCHAFYLVQTGNPLVKGNFEAWQYGPVHREAYDAFKKFGAGAITEDADRFDPVTGTRKLIPQPADREALDVVQKVMQFYGPKSASELVALTHAENGPWDVVVNEAKSNANIGLKISDGIIVERFKYLWFGPKPNLKDQEPNEEKPLVA